MDTPSISPDTDSERPNVIYISIGEIGEMSYRMAIKDGGRDMKRITKDIRNAYYDVASKGYTRSFGYMDYIITHTSQKEYYGMDTIKTRVGMIHYLMHLPEGGIYLICRNDFAPLDLSDPILRFALTGIMPTSIAPFYRSERRSKD